MIHRDAIVSRFSNKNKEGKFEPRDMVAADHLIKIYVFIFYFFLLLVQNRCT